MNTDDIEFFGDMDIIRKRLDSHDSDFFETIYNKDSWYIKAKDLFSAANVLKTTIQQELNNRLKNESASLKIMLDSTNLSNSYMLLVGFALENFLKGIFIAREPHNLESLKRMLQLSHNLNDLADHLKIEKTENEQEILTRLTKYTIWDGRYPTPSLKKESEFSKSRGIFLYNIDFKIIEELVKKLEAEF